MKCTSAREKSQRRRGSGPPPTAGLEVTAQGERVSMPLFAQTISLAGRPACPGASRDGQPESFPFLSHSMARDGGRVPANSSEHSSEPVQPPQNGTRMESGAPPRQKMQTEAATGEPPTPGKASSWGSLPSPCSMQRPQQREQCGLVVKALDANPHSVMELPG